MNAGDCSWKPQPSCSPPRRRTSSRPASIQKEARTPAVKASPCAATLRRSLAGLGDESEDLDAEDGKDAGHQVEDQCRPEGQAGGSRPGRQPRQSAPRRRAGGRAAPPPMSGAANGHIDPQSREAIRRPATRSRAVTTPTRLPAFGRPVRARRRASRIDAAPPVALHGLGKVVADEIVVGEEMGIRAADGSGRPGWRASSEG